MSLIPAKKISDDEVAKLRADKTTLNRHSRRQTGMKKACKGKTEGVLECATPEGQCPDFKECHDE